MNILIPVLTLGALGLLFGIGLAIAQRVFHVEQDPALEKINGLLPGANCGACGQAGCFALAEALLGKKTDPGACSLVNSETAKKISEILGIEAKARQKQYADGICSGGSAAKDKYEYIGVEDCAAAGMLEGGQKACRFGCLGFGTCKKACPFGAIAMDKETGLPVVLKEKCVACGKCVEACPKGIMRLFPQKAAFLIKCASHDMGAQVMKVCKNGCIGCGKCVKVCPGNAITIIDSLAVIDYEKCTHCGECVKACPTKVIKGSDPRPKLVPTTGSDPNKRSK
ncbi:MAG: RnfABCDGE type electron transport complex subunit B [Candidatus Omnitrophota bacterium]